MIVPNAPRLFGALPDPQKPLKTKKAFMRGIQLSRKQDLVAMSCDCDSGLVVNEFDFPKWAGLRANAK